MVMWYKRHCDCVPITVNVWSDCGQIATDCAALVAGGAALLSLA